MTDTAAPTLEVDVGRRVVIVSNLRLRPDATVTSTWATTGFARALDSWEGPGVVVVAGNLFDLSGRDDPAAAAAAALGAHPRVTSSLRAFAGGRDRRIVVLAGDADAALTEPAVRHHVEALGAEVRPELDLKLSTAAGDRLVRVEAVAPGAPVAVVAAPLPAVARKDSAPWQAGIENLADPGAMQRFLTSRVLYRRFAKLAWWLLVPIVVALLLWVPFVTTGLVHLFGSSERTTNAIHRAHAATLGTRLLVVCVISAIELAVLAAVLGFLARGAWKSLGGGAIVGPFDDTFESAGATANDAARDVARRQMEEGYAGVVTGSSRQAELTHLGEGFFACAGATGEVIEEHPGRLGLPPVFLLHRQLAWVELETGAELHARLLLARFDDAPASQLERFAGRYRRVHDNHPVVVAAQPYGASWPPPPDLAALRGRSRRIRRWAAGAIAFAGAVNLLSALTPPLRARLHFVLQIVPLGITEAAGALVALSGVGLLVLARGVRRGQQRAWAISVGILAGTLVLHLFRAADLEAELLAALVLMFLLVTRDEFRAESDRPAMRTALVALGVGVVGITVVTTLLVMTTVHFDHRWHHPLPWYRAGQSVVERLVGVQTVRLPDRLDDFLSPALVTVGIGLALVVAVLATRPVVDRRRSAGRLAELRARDIVARHGAGTLDYFSLRSDKHWFFHRDSLIAYAIQGGICLVSPDPIGPRAEREHAWGAFRRFADGNGWVVAVMGSSEDWLPLYRAAGMHDIYIGDEAVVDVQTFSLAGGHMKGLRQAHNRIAKYGYSASFHDPSRLDRATAQSLVPIMSQSRRGDFERGFSMMLGRIFDPRDEGLLMCIVTDPDGNPAAMCQFVPAKGIKGYSLDLMRRDRGEHPNGLIDFALVSTIEHLRQRGDRGLSLNFAAMRSILEGERGDGVTQRVERWALKKMSSFLQIETLWKFNAKYEPEWLPRYVVYDAAEHLVPVVLAVLRAEALAEVPVIGRMIVSGSRKTRAQPDVTSLTDGDGTADDNAAALLPVHDADRTRP
ncbi:MAG TPA: phosphatidylglycerol lysyltransferase domain-containing protein [Acidimicrobiales bacterium]|nr:phosphatidylglycerol lysyltransferase domain-containing protein [Acidimicrobiales bacterium]